ncbi:ABC transporter substrate-binding protein [Streptomyces bauhiniae]|uniref:ABC transporter substrate-binding protein n=1 Tax=Streptomyces bauhiniae TaxID=2340725 RepID=UPI0035E12FF5
MRYRILALLAVISVSVPLFAACGPNSGQGSDRTIVVGITDRFTTSAAAPAPFDPAYAYDVGSWNILRNTVQTLMAVPKGDGSPVPDAAEKCSFTDRGDERYACALRPGLHFSNGDPITAADVKFSMDRVRAIRADSGVSALLSTVDTIETQGESGIVFHLKTADATFPFKLSTPVAGIVNPRFYGKDRLRPGFQVDASGPYTLKVDAKQGVLKKAIFAKNPQYKGAVSLKNEGVELRSFQGSEAMGAALKAGDIDVMTRAMSPEQIRKLSDAADDAIDIVETPGLETRFLAFNTEAPAVRNRAVRQAMAQVIDRGELVSKVYGAQADPLYSLVAAGVTGHTNSFFNEYSEPSAKKAKAILSDASVSYPVKLVLHYTTDHYGAATQKEFGVLRSQLNASGLFDVTIAGTPWADFRPAERDGKYEVYGMGWFPDFPDADNYIAPFLDAGNTLASPYVNDTIRDGLIPRSRRAANRLDAVSDLTRIQEIVATDVPIIPLWQGKQYIAVRDDITGASYALDSSATLRLGELQRGMKS